MALVYLFFIFSSLCAFVLSKDKVLKCSRKPLLFGLFIILVCIMGLRSEYVGADSVQYYLSFNELNQMSLQNALMTRYAAGYVLFVRFIGGFTDSPYCFFFIVSFATLVIYFHFFRKYSANIFFSIIVFFCLYWTDFLVLTRQACASCLVCLGIPFLLDDRKKIYALFVLGAMLFHESAIIALSFILLVKLKVTATKIMICLLCAIFCAEFFLPLLWKLITVLNVGSYAAYVNSKFNSAGTSVFVDLLIKVFPSLLCLIYGYRSTSQGRTKEQNFFLALNLIGLCFIIIGMKTLILQRLGMYFNLGAVIVCSYLFFLKRKKNSSTQILAWGLIIFSIAIFSIIQIERPIWMRISPYSPFWAPFNAYGVDAIQYFW